MSGVEQFDVRAAINRFISDEHRESMQLPWLTSAQRKETKQVVDEHDELTCVSYGFGQERRLHVFKGKQNEGASEDSSTKATTDRSAQSTNQPSYSVKNTFVDDWADAERQSEDVLFRSTPAQLSSIRKSTLSAESQEEDVIAEIPAIDTCKDRVTVRGQSEDFRLPDGLRVENTFICGGEVEDADDRVVQSMPHGMFRQALLEEKKFQDTHDVIEEPLAEGDANGYLTDEELVDEQPPLSHTTSAIQFSTPAPVSRPELAVQASLTAFKPGDSVLIRGLTRLPAFNGLVGVVESVDHTIGRYKVMFANPVNGQRFAKVRAENLQPALMLGPSQERLVPEQSPYGTPATNSYFTPIEANNMEWGPLSTETSSFGGLRTSHNSHSWGQGAFSPVCAAR